MVANSVVGSSSLRPLTNTRSALDSTAAALGLGSNVWESSPSGTIPVTDARSPAMLATIEVIGATVVTTWSFVPAGGPPDGVPALRTAAGHSNDATLAAAAVAFADPDDALGESAQPATDAIRAASTDATDTADRRMAWAPVANRSQ